MSFFQPQEYINVTELLVKEEIKQQTVDFESNWTEDLSIHEVIAYTLNRLPSRYATSQEGLYRLKQLVKQKMGAQIQSTVAQALSVVNSHPTRLTTPLRPPEEVVAEEEMLKLALANLVSQD